MDKQRHLDGHRVGSVWGTTWHGEDMLDCLADAIKSDVDNQKLLRLKENGAPNGLPLFRPAPRDPLVRHRGRQCAVLGLEGADR